MITIPPPLPDLTARRTSPPSLRSGCYLINYTPTGAPLVSYDGTLRLDTATGSLIASGDLYQRALVISDDADLSGTLVLAPPPDPAAGIPIFPIPSYRYYLRVTQIEQTSGGVSLAFEALRFNSAEVTLLDGIETNFPKEGAFTAVLAPAGGRSPGDHLVGDVTNEAGTAVGRLSMDFVSTYLRKGTVVVDGVARSERPIDDGAGLTWRLVFDKVGWDVTLVVNDHDVAGPSDESWDDGEAHAAMRALSSNADLDTEWRYHLLVVRLLAHGDPGNMYDKQAIDINNVPREGCVIASDWKFGNEDKWGVLKGMRAGAAVATYFRTAVHETGHVMGLEHNIAENGIMRPTNGIADASTPETPFPTNIHWSFARDDEHRLRHWPDIIVRPGGLAWTSGGDAPINALESDKLRLEVSPLLATVPLGAPVRVNLALSNVSDEPVSAPISLSLKSGFVRGRVVDSSGKSRTFSPLVIDRDAVLNELQPGMPVRDSLTLCSGPQGALFPAPGAYRVIVDVSWQFADTIDVLVSGVARVVVTAAVDAAHAEAARMVLTTPETLLSIAFGGDHLTDGIAAIGAALKNDVLRPHFAYIEARRRATRFLKRRPDLKGAAKLIDDTTVMSPAELSTVVQMVKKAGKTAGAAAMAAKLEARNAASASPLA